MKKFFLFTLVLAFLGMSAKAQNYEFKDIKSASTGGIQAIKNGNEVIGYISVLYLDKVSRKEKKYGIYILDVNLQKTHYQEFILSKREYLIGQAFNMNSFCLAYYDSKKKVINYVIYDLKLKEIGRLASEDYHPSLAQSAASRPDDDKLNLGGLYAVPNKGYIRHSYVKKKGYKASIQMFDNSGEVLWTTGTGFTGKMHESAETHHVDDKLVISTIMNKKSAFSSEMKSFVVAHDINTGEELYRAKSEDKKYQMFPYDISKNQESNELIVCGEYYKTGQNMLKVKSQGFYIQVYDASSGSVKTTSYIDWKKDVAKKLPANKKNGYKDMDVSIHKMLVTKQGKVYAIGEQFKKSANGVGIAANVLMGGNSDVANVQVEIHDIMVFEFDSTLSLENVHVFDKNTSKIWLPKGYGILRGHLLANLLKLEGDFDHCYTSITPERTSFNSVYVDYDRKKESRFTIGIIGLNDQFEVAHDSYELKTKPYLFYVCEAKPGYVAIVEYFKDDDKLTIRLEKSNIE